MNGKHLTFWERAEAFPPILCRLLSRHPNGKPKTAGEIARDSWQKISVFEVEALARENSWEIVQFQDMRYFLVGCGLDFCNGVQMKRVDSYLKSKPNFEYLRRSPDWKTLYLPMLVKWRGGYCGEVSKEIWKPVQDLLIKLAPLERSPK